MPAVEFGSQRSYGLQGLESASIIGKDDRKTNVRFPLTAERGIRGSPPPLIDTGLRQLKGKPHPGIGDASCGQYVYSYLGTAPPQQVS